MTVMQICRSATLKIFKADTFRSNKPKEDAALFSKHIFPKTVFETSLSNDVTPKNQARVHSTNRRPKRTSPCEVFVSRPFSLVVAAPSRILLCKSDVKRLIPRVGADPAK